MESWTITAAPALRAEITVPGDKSISHRAVILAGLSNGPCVISGFLPSEDCLSTVGAMRALGVKIEHPEPTTLIVHGASRHLCEPAEAIDCGNSGTTMRLLAGVLAAQPFQTRLVGDASLSRRPMKRVIEPLTLMGATLSTEGEKSAPPLIVKGNPALQSIHYHTPVSSAQVKSAVLLAGLFAKGRTQVTEPEQSRNHTERMLEWFLVGPHVDGFTTTVVGPKTPESRNFRVPGDLSSAAFWLVAAAAQPGSHLLIKNIGLNPTRTGLLDVLIRMGSHVREIIETAEGEPIGMIEIQGEPLKGTVIGGKEIPNVIDELPILAVAGALAQGSTVITDASELRVKETDRLSAIATNLRAMGVSVTENEDGLEIYGGTPLQGARVNSFGDHRIAMAFAIAGLFAEGKTIIDDVECVNTSYPGFLDMLRQLTESEEEQIPVIGTLPAQENDGN